MSSCFFLKDFIYLLLRGTEQREQQAPCRVPEVVLDPGTPRSHPGPKAGAKPLSHPGIPLLLFFISFVIVYREGPLPLNGDFGCFPYLVFIFFFIMMKTFIL